ncbi:glycoside hydrolase family 2 protein [Pseudofrankia saprophytica]|uniref:glycoside hydrolase family 2 protein n=1 Tax=Pseudofrankia saprophytica TaxID=298655 RepID=UPI00030A7593|nr:sugar-binding domain-containing protein [Pseudofrankia saprophytica]
MLGRRLRTAWSRAATTSSPLPEYPRPQLARSSWLSLNGHWEFRGERGPAGPAGLGDLDDLADLDGRGGHGEPPVGRRLPRRILVPFPVESALSGIGEPHERMWYRRTFQVPPDWAADRVHLNFGAVDWECRVWVNGVAVGAHRGGYDAFSFDITPHLTGREEEVLVHVLDPTDRGGQPLGKQRRHPGGIFYTSVSGIWQTVWLDRTPPRYVSRLTLTPDLAAGAVHVVVNAVDADPRPAPDMGPDQARSSAPDVAAPDVAAPDVAVPVRVEVRAGLAAEAATVAAGTGVSGRPFTVAIPDVRAWSPEDPFLYGVTVTLADDRSPGPDRVDSYVGMRSIEVTEVSGEPRPLLNGRFVLHFGPLDQGYWPDGVYTAPTDDALRRDIEVAKELGFTCIRKHAKVEPARWYHWADRLGMLVWQDMPSMPHDREPDEAARGQFEAELRALVEQCRGFPSVIGWVPFNEGWGQYDVQRIAQTVRDLDATRLISENSGSADPGNHWVDAGAGDVADLHAYPGPAAVAASAGRCRALGEFGGIGLAVTGHTWHAADGFSYEWAASRDRLTDRYLGMVDELCALVRDQGLSIAIYTQATDVEGEYNGLLTYDRAVLKVDPDRVRAAHQRLYDTTRAISPATGSDAG